jgi:hypothetical protein
LSYERLENFPEKRLCAGMIVRIDRIAVFQKALLHVSLLFLFRLLLGRHNSIIYKSHKEVNR